MRDDFYDDDDDDARGIVGWLSTHRSRETGVRARSGGGGGDFYDDGFYDDDEAERARKRLDDDDDGGDGVSVSVSVSGGAPMLDEYHHRRVGLDAAERALDAELDAAERALARGGRKGLDEAFAMNSAGGGVRDDDDDDDGGEEEEGGGGGIAGLSATEPPKMWNARFVADVLSTTAGRFDASAEEEEEGKGGEGIDGWRFSPPVDAGVFAASIPVVSERVVNGETFTSRLDDILDRVDVARALAMEAKKQLRR
jgi:hypothetical protein